VRRVSRADFAQTAFNAANEPRPAQRRRDNRCRSNETLRTHLAQQRICAVVATVSCPATAASRVSVTLGTHHSVGWLPRSAASTAAASHPCRTASRSATDRSRRTPRRSPRRTRYLPPPRRIFTIRSMLSPCEPATTCSTSPPAAIFTHTGFSSGCRCVAAGLCGYTGSVPADDRCS
jgi:hypothetical protein